MRVMTYNIAAACRQPHHNRLDNLENIARVIAAQAPDIIALQEVDQCRPRSGAVEQARWLGERLGYHWKCFPSFTIDEHDGTIGAYGQGLLSRFPIASCRGVRLWGRKAPLPGEPAWVIEPRLCWVARIEATTPINVLGCHLSTTRDQRERQLEDLARLLDPQLPNVLMGDFNADRAELAESPLARLMSNIFTATPVPTFPNGSQARACIDHILVSPQWQVEAAWVVSERLGRSDHNPVVADITLPTPEQA